jgi:sulfur relay (sulfurtransferase) complex TusBCD TusD component (DsrE family)
MNVFYTALIALLAFAALPTATFADDDDPLFVNLTTDETHRARMALVFASRQQQLGRPIIVFLNDRGVLLGSTKNSDKFKEHQQVLAAMIGKGADVLACPMCMEHYGVDETDLSPGIKLSNPEVVGEALFGDDDTKALSW